MPARLKKRGGEGSSREKLGEGDKHVCVSVLGHEVLDGVEWRVLTRVCCACNAGLEEVRTARICRLDSRSESLDGEIVTPDLAVRSL